jgi:dolichol kinase
VHITATISHMHPATDTRHTNSKHEGKEEQQQQLDEASHSDDEGSIGTPYHWASAAAAISIIASMGSSVSSVFIATAIAAASLLLFHFLMLHMPRSFTLGEGALVASMISLPLMYLPSALQCLPACAAATWAAVTTHLIHHSNGDALLPAPSQPSGNILPAVMVLIYAVLAAAAGIWIIRQNVSRNKQPSKHHKLSAATAAAAVLLAVSAAAIILVLASWTLLVFLPASLPSRMTQLAGWSLLLAVALPLMQLLSSTGLVKQIIIRKGYHVLAIALFLPSLLVDAEMLCLSLAIAFAALVALEAARCVQMPLLGPAVQSFMERFVDSRDSGPVYVTHFTLLLGLAGPIWLSQALRSAAVGPASVSSTVGVTDLHVLVCAVAGLMVVGVGDAAASVVGSMYGQVKLFADSSKTLEGTLGAVLCCLAAWLLLLWPLGLLSSLSAAQLLNLATSTAWACLLEAATSQLDNLVVPVYYLLLLLAGL